MASLRARDKGGVLSLQLQDGRPCLNLAHHSHVRGRPTSCPHKEPHTNVQRGRGLLGC